MIEPLTVPAALVILLPCAEALAGPFRARYDRAAADGMPAHLTLLYPFRPAGGLGPATRATLMELSAAQPAFSFQLDATGEFPGVLYLAPEDSAPFICLAESLWRRFPESPPYGGSIREMVPHLTVADLQPDPIPETLREAFAIAAERLLPMEGRVTVLTLMVLGRGGWEVSGEFPLGRGSG